MKKIKKIKERILSVVLTCAMMATLLVGIPPMEVHAEETEGNIKDLASIVTYDESTKEIIVNYDSSKEYIIDYMPYSLVVQYGYTPEIFNRYEGTPAQYDAFKDTPVISSLDDTSVRDYLQGKSNKKICDVPDITGQYISSTGTTRYSVDGGALFVVYEVSSDAKHTYNGKDYYKTYGVHAVFYPADTTSGGTECDHDWEVLYDADDHYRKCVDCQQEADRAAHTFTNNVCSICGYEKKYTITIERVNFDEGENIDLRYNLYDINQDRKSTKVQLNNQTSFEVLVGETFDIFIYEAIDYDYTVTLKSGTADFGYWDWNDSTYGTPIYQAVSLDSDITIVLTKIVEGSGDSFIDTVDVNFDWQEVPLLVNGSRELPTFSEATATVTVDGAELDGIMWGIKVTDSLKITEEDDYYNEALATAGAEYINRYNSQISRFGEVYGWAPLEMVLSNPYYKINENDVYAAYVVIVAEDGKCFGTLSGDEYLGNLTCNVEVGCKLIDGDGEALVVFFELGTLAEMEEEKNEAGGTPVVPATTYDITLDRTNYADGYVDLYTYDNEGSYVANTEDNNATITMPEGGKVRVFADSEFTVTAEGATISEMLSAGEEGYYYEITGIAADTTIVVNLKQNTPVVVAPAITSQPQNISVQEGQKATFSVTATGDNLSYQWQINRNDGNGFVNLSGATSASYTTSTVDMDCNGFKYLCIVSNEGGSVTTNIATLTVTESSSVHTHSLTLVPAKAATCTTAGNKAYYTCSGCDSLFADANGTTITTAEAVKVAALEHDWTGEWTIIKEATETEDGKKETLCTRGCGQKKVAIIPATGTADDNSNLEKDAEVAPDAPIDEATLNNSKEELFEADNIFTDAEKTQIANGTDARVWIEISKTDESAIASTDKAKIEQEAAEIIGNNPTITYFDADLFKQVGSAAKQEITEPGIAMKITIVIPDELLNTDKKVSREYKIIRLHEGQVDVINGTFDSTTGEFTFETDKFSTYAIVYKDVPVNDDDDNSTPGDTDVIKPEDDKKDEVPKTGDSNTTLYSFILMLLSGLGIIICSGKKKLLNKES